MPEVILIPVPYGTVLMHVLLSVLIAASLYAIQQGAQSVTEPESGVAFPVTITAGEGEQALTGTGIRTRTVAKVKVYAFGLYVDPQGARQALAGWAGRSERDLQQDASFYEALLKGDFGKTLRLVMTRDVEGARMAEAFDDVLGPRVRRAGTEMNMPGGDQALASFRGLFDGLTMTKGSELVFTCLPGGTLKSTIQGKPAADIQSPALCWALFDVYLGKDPISGGGKKTVIARVPQILAAQP
jgi:hypothetical protein